MRIRIPEMSLTTFRHVTFYSGTGLVVAAYLLLLYAGWRLHPVAFLAVLAVEIYFIAQAVLTYYEWAERALMEQQLRAQPQGPPTERMN